MFFRDMIEISAEPTEELLVNKGALAKCAAFTIE